MNSWQLNSAAEWQLELPDRRYRIEEWHGKAWLYDIDKDYSCKRYDLVGRYDSAADAMKAIERCSNVTVPGSSAQL